MNNNTDKAEMKECKKCCGVFPATKEFFSFGDGRIKSPCRKCANENKRLHYSKNRERLVTEAKERYQKNKKIKEKQKDDFANDFTLKGIWVKIKYNSNYLISNDAQVYSINSKKILKPNRHTHGYLVVSLWENNKQKRFYIHRLVLEHFSNEKPKDTVNHIDGNKTNNHISNLEWATYKDNNVHAVRTGLRKSNMNNKIMSTPVEQRDLKGNLIKVYPSMRQAERETGISATEIGLGVKKGWKYGGFQWLEADEYKERSLNMNN